MSLLTYDDARPWAKSIARAVRSGDMPPWGASAEHGAWSNDMSLSPDAVETIVRWVQTGALEGDPSDLPAQPVFPEGWLLGEPDYIIELDEVVIPAGGDDLFPKQWVDLSDLGGEKWVKAIQFLPGDRRAAQAWRGFSLRTPSHPHAPSGGRRTPGAGSACHRALRPGRDP